MVEGALTDRTQPALSVEADCFVVVEVSVDDDDEPVSDFVAPGLALESPLDELLVDCLVEDPSPLTEVIDEDSAPRLSVL
ncbi:MAG: hypothetical protein WCB51_15265 [Candidatus Dormiibacterota bacterium]